MKHVYKLPPELENKIPQPPSICQECLEGNSRLLLRQPTVMTTYCEHSFTGAAVDLKPDRPLWRAWAPLSRDEWESMLADSAKLFAQRGAPE